MNKHILADIQALKPEQSVYIDRAGVRGLCYSLLLRDRQHGLQKTVATVDLGVDLSPDSKGIHMSRLVEALDLWKEEISCQTMKAFLKDMAKRLNAENAWAKFSFPYIIRKQAPLSGGSANMAYNCSITGEFSRSVYSFLVDLEVPVITVCPCSKAISREGAHSQRALVRIKIRISSFVWLEEFIDIAEKSASSAVYPLLKREDEKFVTELAFSNASFVEDAARNVANHLKKHPKVEWFEVEVESMESIHNHNAFACIKC